MVYEEARERQAGVEVKSAVLYVNPAQQGAWEQLLFLEAQLPVQPHTKTDSTSVEGEEVNCLLLQKVYKRSVSKGNAFLFHSCQSP